MNINFNHINDVRSCLETLVALGNEAQRKLDRLGELNLVSWATLFDEFESRSLRPLSSVSRTDYLRWTEALVSWGIANQIALPRLLARDDAQKAIAELWGRKVSSLRIAGFFRRVWETLGLDDQTWSFRPEVENTGRYRRLTSNEINSLYRYLRESDPDFADIFAIGYYTGLRLSDINELEISEVDQTHAALSIVPNKLKSRKPIVLKIPLVREAMTIITERLKNPDNEGHLFPERCRRHASRKFTKAFRACKITIDRHCKASFHSIRATFISLMDDAQVQPYLTDAITGHASRTMHGRYSQPSVKALRQAILKAIPSLVGSDGVSET